MMGSSRSRENAQKERIPCELKYTCSVINVTAYGAFGEVLRQGFCHLEVIVAAPWFDFKV